MANTIITGLIGIIFLAIAWIPEVIEIIKTRKSRINWEFGSLYVLGSIMLVIYSWQIKDTIFLILNSIIALMSSLSLYYSLKKRI